MPRSRERLRGSGPRVIKQNRGNGGQGVWKVEAVGGAHGAARRVCVLHAHRGSVPEELPLERVHGALRTLFRVRRLHHRSAVSSRACPKA